MNDCTLMNFLCGFLLGLILGFCLCVCGFEGDQNELKQFREQKLIEQELNQRGCK